MKIKALPPPPHCHGHPIYNGRKVGCQIKNSKLPKDFRLVQTDQQRSKGVRVDHYNLIHKGQEIGNFSVFIRGKDIPYVDMVEISHYFRNQGLCKTCYLMLLEIYGKLASAPTLTSRDAYRVWKSLGASPLDENNQDGKRRYYLHL